MAMTFLERLQARKRAVEGGDPTGGEAFGERRNAAAVRKELGASRKISNETSKAQGRKRTR